LKRTSLQVAALGCAAALLAPPGAHASARQDRVERSITHLLNAARAGSGLPVLHSSRRLNRRADRHSAAMARTNTLMHAPARASRRRISGETVAWMPRGTHGLASQVVSAWMNSPAHRAALLDGRFHRVGVARRRGPSGTFVTAELLS
jgi:uncharacterized protein YkwD